MRLRGGESSSRNPSVLADSRSALLLNMTGWWRLPLAAELSVWP
jgi:hypothetical protein